MEPKAYECGITPHEFWNSNYRELKLYVNSFYEQKKESFKEQVILFEQLGNKILSAVASKHPKRVSLIHDIFKNLFEDEHKKQEVQSIEEMVRNLRARM